MSLKVLNDNEGKVSWAAEGEALLHGQIDTSDCAVEGDIGQHEGCWLPGPGLKGIRTVGHLG